MRIEYNFGLNEVEVPNFSVETTEGLTKLFTLSTLILNVLSARGNANLIFHSLSQADLPKKIEVFRQIIASAPKAPEFTLTEGKSGSVGTSYFVWVSIHSSDADA